MMKSLLFITLAPLGLFPTVGTLHAAEHKPDIRFMLVDDCGIKDVGIEGSTFYETPNIDKLAHSGLRFTQGCAVYLDPK